MGRSGVRVNAVAPGWIASSGFDTYPDDVKPMLRSLRKHTPLQRFGTEAEVSAAIVFLLSPAAGFISGDTLRVDGAAPNAKRHVDARSRTTAPSPGTASTAPSPPSCCRRSDARSMSSRALCPGSIYAACAGASGMGGSRGQAPG